MSIEFPFFAFFPVEKKRSVQEKAGAEKTTADDAAQKADEAAATVLESSDQPAPKFEPKPFRVKSGSRRRRKRSTKT